MKRGYAICLAVLAAGVLLLQACREEKQEEAPRHLFAEFFVRYLQAEQEIKAYASFFEGDTLQSAVPKAFARGAAFQGESMEARNLPGGTIRYTLEGRGSYASSFRFTFRDDSGQEREISVAMAPIDSFAVEGGQASRSGGMALFARGGKLDSGESMVLLFSDEHNKASTIMLTGPSAGETYRIPAAKVEALHPGRHSLYLVKKKRSVVNGDTLSSVADIEYYTDTIELEVVE